MSADFACLVCRESRSEPVLLGCRDLYLGHPLRVDYHRCVGCGLVQQVPLPMDTSSFYTSYPIHGRKSALYVLLRRLVMGQVYFDTRSVRPGTVLVDYGCGDGGYLEGLKDAGLELVGFEANPSHAENLAVNLGLPVFGNRQTLLQAYGGRAGVVTMHFVLEHVIDLDAAFSDAAALLGPGGTFYFVVPDIASLEARTFGRKWHNLDPPRHISFPDREAARRLAARHGLELVEDRPVAFPNGVAASLAAVVGGRFRFPLFALFLPVGLVVSRLSPGGSRAYRLLRS